jgi:hypothetical protein
VVVNNSVVVVVSGGSGCSTVNHESGAGAQPLPM